MEGVEWSIPVGLDVLDSSYPHLKTIARRRGLGLDKRYHMYEAGRGGRLLGGGGVGGACFFKVEAGTSSPN